MWISLTDEEVAEIVEPVLLQFGAQKSWSPTLAKLVARAVNSTGDCVVVRSELTAEDELWEEKRAGLPPEERVVMDQEKYPSLQASQRDSFGWRVLRGLLGVQ